MELQSTLNLVDRIYEEGYGIFNSTLSPYVPEQLDPKVAYATTLIALTTIVVLSAYTCCQSQIATSKRISRSANEAKTLLSEMAETEDKMAHFVNQFESFSRSVDKAKTLLREIAESEDEIAHLVNQFESFSRSADKAKTVLSETDEIEDRVARVVKQTRIHQV